MTKYQIIEPEVIVGLGTNTIFDNTPKRDVEKLHILLEDWLGDDLMLISNCYVVTERLKIALLQKSFRGYIFDEIEVTKDEYFDNNYQLEKPLPNFFWMKITGRKGESDCYIENLDLHISSRFLKFLQENFQLNFFEIDPERDQETDDFILSLIQRDKNSDT